MTWLHVLKWRLGTELAILTAVTVSAVLQPYRVIVVQGESMSPTYHNRSLHLVKRRTGVLYRGEVVVINSNVGMLVKRVAFLPGDSIKQIKVGPAWIDLIGPSKNRTNSPTIKTRYQKVPPGCVYVIGDNWSQSMDSTTLGPMPMENVWGVLVDQRARPHDNVETSRTYWLYR